MTVGAESEYREATLMTGAADVQATDAHYYPITEAGRWTVAGLLVLLDGHGQPARAELHLYDDLPSHIHEGAVRQCRQLLQAHYATDATVPMRVLMNTPMRDAVEVRLEANSAPTQAKRPRPGRLFALIGSLAILVLALLGLFSLRGSEDLSPGRLLSMGGLLENGAAKVNEIRTLSASGRSTSGAADANGEGVAALPPSVNAREDLRVGTRVAIIPGLRLTLRSEPGADAGVPVGYMMDDDTAVIVGGPHLSAGTSDTIVWWLVNLDDGTEAWAAANTSDKTLLIPAP